MDYVVCDRFGGPVVVNNNFLGSESAGPSLLARGSLAVTSSDFKRCKYWCVLREARIRIGSEVLGKWRTRSRGVGRNVQANKSCGFPCRLSDRNATKHNMFFRISVTQTGEIFQLFLHTNLPSKTQMIPAWVLAIPTSKRIL